MALFNKFAQGDEVLLEALIKQRADVHVKNDFGVTSLFMAVLADSSKGVRILLSAGAKPDALKPKTGETALLMAAQKKNIGIVEALIEAGADVNLTSRLGLTPLFIATVVNADDVVKRLLEAGADPNLRDEKKNTSPLYIAAERGNVNNIKALLWAKAKTNDYTERGATPLYVASEKGQFDAVKVLLEAGADHHISVREDGHVQAPLMIAAINEHDNIVALLEKDLPRCSGQEIYKGWGLFWMENYFSVEADLKAMNDINKNAKLRFVRTSSRGYAMDFNPGHSVRNEKNKEKIFVDGKEIYEGRWKRRVKNANSFSYVMPKLGDDVIDSMSKGRSAELRIIANVSGEFLVKSVTFFLKDFSKGLERVKNKMSAVKTKKAQGRCRVSKGMFGMPF